MHALSKQVSRGCFVPSLRCPGRSRASVRVQAVHHVVATREKGKNSKLIKALQEHSISCLELPLIEHAEGPERDLLPTLLNEEQFDWITITSPEAASVFIQGWKKAGSPKVRIAVVGGGTGEVLQDAGLQPEFTSSKALGKTMGAELPHVPGGSSKVLYPASVKASTDLQDSLASAGYTVKRINTYDTRGVRQVAEEQLQSALQADIVTFGSPSAVKAWVALVGLEAAQSKVSVCIGSTSAKVCHNLGLTKVMYPESPGIQGWVDCIVAARKELGSVAAA